MRRDKNLAINLRKRGKSYNEISKIINAPKSTLSVWLRDVKMPARIKKEFWSKTREKWAKSITEFNKKQGERARRKSEKLQENATNSIKNLSKKDLLLVGTALYWAEGYKKSRWTATFSNSDPSMIEVIMKFFEKICGVPKRKLKAIVQIHPNVTPKQAINYWSRISRIPQNQFSKCYSRLSPSSKQKRPINTLPYGTLRISVYNYKIINKIKGWIKGISQNV